MMAKERWQEPDRVYGEIRVESPVITALVASRPMQRLQRLNQFGIPDEFYHLTNYSRFEHSLGVMQLLRSLGASEEEQVAGLLHDVSHRAFSHIYDWVVETAGQENSQDEGHEQFIRHSEIAIILESHGFPVDRITDYHHFGLLERDSPDLCADRIDYALRELDIYLAQEIFRGITVFEGQMVCKDLETATELGRAFLGLQTSHWGGYEGVARYYLFSSALKIALEKGIISKDDFLIDDDNIVQKLKIHPDSQIQRILGHLRRNPLPKVSEGPTVVKKFRYVDPPFLTECKLVRLTEIDEDFRELLTRAREENKNGVVVSDLLSFR